ncbi:hypothetical protein TNCV_1273791 [Trichonephila clavipes]|nr:hypothetical protein TNCV_1273791 [Trichonephila clavipes]
MEASEVMPIAEGTELTLACMIQGSENMKVKWFKDGYPVHVHTGERSMWTTIVPKNSQDQYTALLGFDRVASLDTGKNLLMNRGEFEKQAVNMPWSFF